MNEHAVPGQSDGYLFEFAGKRPLRETAWWLTGAGLTGAGVAIAAVGTASQTLLAMPSGIAVAVLGLIVLFLCAANMNKTKPASVPARPLQHRVKDTTKMRGRESIASQLALIANLYSDGALTAEEFVAAKRRILDI